MSIKSMPTKIPSMMTAVQLLGHGGLDQLVLTEVPVPAPSADEVLIKVGAAGINNTDINTRVGWYSKSVQSDTGTGAEQGFENADAADASWSGVPLQLPRIQGADACGTVVAVGTNVDSARVGQRVIVRTMQDALEPNKFDCVTFGSEMNGGFAEYTVCRSSEAWAVKSHWGDVELASIPCAYSTAENMLHRAKLTAPSVVLVTGASGGVGSAVVQLAKRRGAYVMAVAGAKKMSEVAAIGADCVIDRSNDLLDHVPENSIDLVVDLVAGQNFASLLKGLKRGGSYVTAGAIGGPIVELDVRTLYLKDITLLGSTYQAREVFDNLVRYIETDEIRPVVAKSYPLAEIHQAQKDFMAKNFVGKLVLVP